MARYGWNLVALGLAAAAASAAPFVYAVATRDDPSLIPAVQAVLMTLGGFTGLVLAVVGGTLVFKARSSSRA